MTYVTGPATLPTASPSDSPPGRARGRARRSPTPSAGSRTPHCPRAGRPNQRSRRATPRTSRASSCRRPRRRDVVVQVREVRDVLAHVLSSPPPRNCTIVVTRRNSGETATRAARARQLRSPTSRSVSGVTEHRLELAEKRASADDPLRVVSDAFAQAAIGRHQRERPFELGDGVVGGSPPEPTEIGRVFRRIAVEDDQQLRVLASGPGACALHQLFLREVRPRRAPDVFSVDDDERFQIEPSNVSHAPSLPCS